MYFGEPFRLRNPNFSEASFTFNYRANKTTLNSEHIIELNRMSPPSSQIDSIVFFMFQPRCVLAPLLSPIKSYAGVRQRRRRPIIKAHNGGN